MFLNSSTILWQIVLLEVYWLFRLQWFSVKAMILAALCEASVLCGLIKSWTKHLGTRLHLQYFPFRWNGHPTEGLSGMHSVSAVERNGPGPGRKSQGDSGSGAGLQRALQQLREVVPQRREVQGKAQRLLLWLHLLRIRRAVLLRRWVWRGCPSSKTIQRE